MLSLAKSAWLQVGVMLDRDLTAASALDRACRTHPDSPLFHLDTSLDYRRLSGSIIDCLRLRDFTNRVGNLLRNAGLRRYDRVAVYKTNSPDYFFLALAIIRAGGIAVPINPGMTLSDLNYYLGYTGSNVMITDARVFGERVGDPANCPAIKTWVFPDAPVGFTASHVDLNSALEHASPELDPVQLGRDSDIIIAHTSGTTGFPKGVISTSGSLLRSARAQFSLGPMTENDRTAVAAPFNHLVAHTGMLSAMLGNLKLWPVTRTDGESVLGLIERERISVFFAFPDVYLGMYEAGLDQHRLASMRVWVGTADTSHEVHKRAFTETGGFLRIFGRRILRSVFVDAFGSSEIGFAALTQISSSHSKPKFKRLLGTPNPAGPKVKIADEEGRPMRAGQVGRIMVKGPTLFKGYWNAHDRLHGAVRDGWWWTGDVGYRDRLGRFYHLDRMTDVINTPEGPVYSLLAEEILMNHPDISETVVFGVRHPERATVAIAVVNTKPGHGLDTAECLGWVNQRLRSHIGLASVIVVEPEKIPRGLTGKVLKRVLRDRYADMFQTLETEHNSGAVGVEG